MLFTHIFLNLKRSRGEQGEVLEDVEQERSDAITRFAFSENKSTPTHKCVFLFLLLFLFSMGRLFFSVHLYYQNNETGTHKKCMLWVCVHPCPPHHHRRYRLGFRSVKGIRKKKRAQRNDQVFVIRCIENEAFLKIFFFFLKN